MRETFRRTELAQMLIEQFLIKTDDGWILRKARFYRGAFQEEGERAGAQGLLLHLAGNILADNSSYLQLRSAASLLPHGLDTPSARSVRQLATTIAEMDPGFVRLRNKIHIQPQPGDAVKIMDYAAKVEDPQLKTELMSLAREINSLYTVDATSLVDGLAARISRTDPSAAQQLRAAWHSPQPESSPEQHFGVIAQVLKLLREITTGTQNPSLRLQAVDTSLVVEADGFAATAALSPLLRYKTRRELLSLLGDNIRALYGTGLVSLRQYHSLEAAMNRLTQDAPSLRDYRRELRYLGLVPEWANRSMNFLYRDGMEKFAEIEPGSRLFIQDMLRGSLLFYYAQIIDILIRDGDQLAGIHNTFFHEDIGAGLRALNPGLAHGVLHIDPGAGEFDPRGIYVLPETEADLPPVAGIITAGEGNPLSHVQLLARNLGIPNVAVSTAILEKLKPHDGQRVMLAISPGGTVQLDREPAQAGTGKNETVTAQASVRIHGNTDKLNLGARELIGLGDLRAADSGVIVGPKAARLGELKHYFPESVAQGVAIPFGIFRQLLNQDGPEPGVSMFDWMVRQYRHLDSLPADSRERRESTERFREKVYQWVLNADPGKAFRENLLQVLHARFGTDGSYGVFVRSDTNVEDLPGFTGAGLNLTLPNVVGTENILRAVNQVWASPFTSRAFAWRQALMEQPEHVYPAVLLMQGVDVDKSGVLVTADIDTGDRDWLSVAVNEGVGGAVEGQAAESLRIHVSNGEIRLLAQASASTRHRLSPAGGIQTLPASGRDYLLTRDEIMQLLTLARELPRRFPPVVDDKGNSAAADIEFGFINGKLQLFQIRPFLENEQTRDDRYLRTMDPDPDRLSKQIVNLEKKPLATSY